MVASGSWTEGVKLEGGEPGPYIQSSWTPGPNPTANRPCQCPPSAHNVKAMGNVQKWHAIPYIVHYF